MKRRSFLKEASMGAAALGTLGSSLPLWGVTNFLSGKKQSIRRFHASISSQGWEANPELPSILKNAGVTDI
jgi:hypothetical protein